MGVNDVLSLLGGLALFLFGMQLMGEKLQTVAGPRMKNALGWMTRNRLMALLAGTVVTGIIQSSSAVTVMVVGFVNAGLMTLSQATGVILGANIGTTVTGLMLSVKVDMGAAFAVLGMVFALISRRESIKQTGYLLVGLGVLFTGMELMTQAMEPLRTWNVFVNLMKNVRSPWVAVLLGTCVTGILQSSSAAVGILQALALQGLVSADAAFYIMLGTNIGTCVTAMIASIGTDLNAKRAAMVHLLFNVIGTLIFMLAGGVLPFGRWMTRMSDNAKLQVALMHVIFNVATTAMLLPFVPGLVHLSCLAVPDRHTQKEKAAHTDAA